MRCFAGALRENAAPHSMRIWQEAWRGPYVLLPLLQRGQLCPELLHLLSPQWLDLPPLRQRRADIPPLADDDVPF